MAVNFEGQSTSPSAVVCGSSRPLLSLFHGQFARLLVLATAPFAAAATKRVWNELPSSVVNVSSLAEFKKRLQTEPLEQYL